MAIRQAQTLNLVFLMNPVQQIPHQAEMAGAYSPRVKCDATIHDAAIVFDPAKKSTAVFGRYSQ